MKHWIIALSLGLSAALPITVYAQSTQELAQKVVVLQQGAEQESLWNDMANRIVVSSLQEWEDRAQKRNIPESQREAVAKKLDAELKKLHTQIFDLLKSTSAQVENNELAKFYADNFTADELKAIIAWYESAAFKKFQSTAPQIAEVYMNGLMERTHSQVKDYQGAFTKKAADILKDY